MSVTLCWSDNSLISTFSSAGDAQSHAEFMAGRSVEWRTREHKGSTVHWGFVDGVAKFSVRVRK